MSFNLKHVDLSWMTKMLTKVFATQSDNYKRPSSCDDIDEKTEDYGLKVQ